MDEATASEHGLLRPQEAHRYIDLRRYPVAGPLDLYVERYWSVRWDLPDGASYESVVVGHPCVNLSFMPSLGAEVHGPSLAVSRHSLSGSGRVFGAKFRPGGFTALTGVDAEALADWSAAATAVFGPEAGRLNTAVTGCGDEPAAAVVSRFLTERIPSAADQRYEQLLRIVAALLEDRSITRVDQAASRFHCSPRSLQRMFQAYIGFGPKTLIRRYRLHDAADRLTVEPGVDLARLAGELGWADQAHFTHDFKNLTGLPPAEYATQCASAGGELVAAHR